MQLGSCITILIGGLYGLQVFTVRSSHQEVLRLDLKLTTNQEQILHTLGGVCICGRSGTGKTEVVVKRMVKDVESCNKTDASKYLFVAHSQKLCSNADRIFRREAQHDVISGNCEPVFLCLVDAIPVIERHFKLEFFRSGRTEQTKVDFKAFKSRFWPQIISKSADCGLSARLVWAKVQSVLKGSIEVVQESGQRYLTKSQYLSLGKKHDRLTQEVTLFTALLLLYANVCVLADS